MNISNLDVDDFMQVICLSAALVIGFVPNVYSLKKQNGEMNIMGIWMILIFAGLILLTFFSTLSKSSSDKDNYKNLFDSTLATLKKSDESVRQTKDILKLEDSSISNLKEITNKSNNIQNQGLSLLAKSEQLNDKLLQEIFLQKQITKKSNDIIDALKAQQKKEARNSHLSFIMNFGELGYAKDILINDFKEIDLDSWTVSVLKGKLGHIPLDSVNKIYNDSLDNIYETYNKNALRAINYGIKDPSTVAKSLKEYFAFVYGILQMQMLNSFVYKNSKLSKIWLDYMKYIFEKQHVYLIDKTSITSMREIKYIMNRHQQFLNDVAANSSLVVALDD
ncbi:MAG: hypothetical protein ABJB11_06715 [Ferruginibacter sp.]